ncbi:H-2 class II histocompatibility antigen, E-S beta chain-like [Micropterus dolomieu]|uniref:H-2 class II histocompatibility antigen, E-S beta chain-like n=1 Tax=Micropterus dolomieu TaxID=147949 RepID=UPI001E8DC577|nr:H-2 class II histocompatibility antigen, E-S beta chain-like [Micropterus dolomieu]
MSHALGFLILQFAFSRADALYGHVLMRCQFSSHDGHDTVLLEQYYLNKMLMFQYNSTLGKLIGYTKEAIEYADFLNGIPSFVNKEKWKADICKRNVPLVYNSLLTPVEPSVRLRSVEAVGSKHPGMLVCSVYDFYPKQIWVTWLRNGKKVTSDVTSTDELPNGNWLYQMHSYLEFTPRPGEKITCMVEHASLMEPKLYDWEPMPESRMNKIAVGTAGLLLCLVFVVAGLIYYKIKSTVRVLVPTTEGLCQEHTL